MAVVESIYGSAQNKTAATTVVVTTTALIPANTLLIMAVCADNTSATAPTITGITAVGGGTWTDRAGSVTQSGASATAGAGVFVYCQTLLTTSDIASGTNITVTFNASPVAKAVGLWALSETSNTLRSTVVSAASTAGTPSATTAGTALVAGDIVVGVIGAESNTVFVDSDTLNGSWLPGGGGAIATSGGQQATNATVLVQAKVVNATGAQTYNASSANDSVAIVFALQPIPPVAPTARTISLQAGPTPQTQVVVAWFDDTAALPDPTYLIESSPNGSTGWTTVATGQTNQTGYTWTAATPGTTYYFRVTGSNSAGSSTSNVAGPITTDVYPKTATFTEPFDTLTAWSTVQGTPNILSGQAQLEHLISGEIIHSIAAYDFTESYLIVRFGALAALPPSNNSRYFEVAVWVDSANAARFRIFFDTTGTTLRTVMMENSGTSLGSIVTYDRTTMPYMRLRLTGTTLGVDYSSDGANWTDTGANMTLTSTLVAKLQVVKVRLVATQSSGVADDPQFALVDSINIVAAAGGQPKVFLSGAFTKKPAKVYSGSSFVTKPVKVWTGSTWKTLT